MVVKKDTLQTIAERTGFSVSTVSRVLSGRAREFRISEAAIARIQLEVEACGYTPDLIAKGLRMKKTDTVGLTIPDIGNPFFASLSRAIIARLKLHGYNILLADTMDSEANEKEALMSFVSRKVDGIIVIPVGDSPEFLERVGSSTPVVLLDRYYESSMLPAVHTDNYAGARKATEYLIGKGYRNILAIQGVMSSMPNRERVSGFCDAIEQSGVAGLNGEVVGDAFSEENGYREIERAFKSGRKIDAVFAFSTTILLGVFNFLREHNVDIPSDIAVISFDDNVFLDYMDPPISRVAQNTVLLGEKAADLVLGLIRGDGGGSGGASGAARGGDSCGAGSCGGSSAGARPGAASGAGPSAGAGLSAGSSSGARPGAAFGAGPGAGAGLSASSSASSSAKNISIMPELIIRSSC